MVTERQIRDEQEMLDFGAEMARLLGSFNGERGPVVYLQGDLGAGKTTLVRGILRSIGYQGSVKSPTYTLLEPYADEGVYHFDFYRIVEHEELEFIGIDELMDAPFIKLIEWPEMAGDRLPAPDMRIQIHIEDSGRRVVCEYAH
ncbi:MAG: tRNA (adenosine(37)-N6)-threonylcarbamoyltransferase complex ATPase subunit type 1 TsaE [Proteobacteria bacterium]|nr:tRNA (adenosine(37)-N6)-threonylcarbamoyltransferase complex ATPase subunit type 1 TsaE [Pseudomonadota bacterium]